MATSNGECSNSAVESMACPHIIACPSSAHVKAIPQQVADAMEDCRWQSSLGGGSWKRGWGVWCLPVFGLVGGIDRWVGWQQWQPWRGWGWQAVVGVGRALTTGCHVAAAAATAMAAAAADSGGNGSSGGRQRQRRSPKHIYNLRSHVCMSTFMHHSSYLSVYR